MSGNHNNIVDSNFVLPTHAVPRISQILVSKLVFHHSQKHGIVEEHTFESSFWDPRDEPILRPSIIPNLDRLNKIDCANYA